MSEVKRDSFLNQHPRRVIEKDLKASWSGGKNAKYFRCGLCGHKFQLNDIYCFIYAGCDGLTNFLVCENCFDNTETMIENRKAMIKELKRLSFCIYGKTVSELIRDSY